MSKQRVFIYLCAIKISFKISQRIGTHPVNLALAEHELCFKQQFMYFPIQFNPEAV